MSSDCTINSLRKCQLVGISSICNRLSYGWSAEMELGLTVELFGVRTRQVYRNIHIMDLALREFYYYCG